MTTTPDQDLIATRAERDVSFFDLYSIDQLTLEDIDLIFELARKFREYKTHKFALNKGNTQINAFFEHSTRTLSSFDLSGKHLSMDTNNVGTTSSVKKGESFVDTLQTLDSYNVKIIIVRSQEAGVTHMLSKHVGAALINAGDGWNEHPTQGLLDGLTMLDHFGTTDLKGKTITIVGDAMHSRVFGSLVRITKKLGANVRLAAPETFCPPHVDKFGLEVFYDVEEAIKDVDIVYTLRVQEERGSKGYIPSLREYSKMFGISVKRLELADKNAILMDPGPVIRDIQIHSALSAVHEQSRILQQVENGMAIRKALLFLLCHRHDGKTKSYQKI